MKKYKPKFDYENPVVLCYSPKDGEYIMGFHKIRIIGVNKDRCEYYYNIIVNNRIYVNNKSDIESMYKMYTASFKDVEFNYKLDETEHLKFIIDKI
jgi:hypothetical protein